jgi:AraC family transcriptional regulator
MPQGIGGDRDLITPDEWLGVLPTAPVATSGPLGWSALRAEHFHHAPVVDLDLPGHTHHLLSVFLRPPERIKLSSEGFEWEAPLAPGSILFLPAEHARRAYWRGSAESVHVHLDPGLVSRVAAEALDLDPGRVEFPHIGAQFHPQLQAAMLALDAELADGAAGGRLLAESLANVIAVQLIRRFVPVDRLARQPRGGLSERQLRATREYIEEHLDSELTLDAIAAVAHLSPYHFARQFKTSTGLPPHQYVITRRVERAKRLLRDSRNLTLAQVAARSGFWDQGHFTRHFKRQVGVTPKRFR